MKFLICDISRKMHAEIQEFDGSIVNSPVQCLNQAIIAPPHAIVVRFGDITLSERNALIELCSILKQNPYTRGIETIALLCSKHRMIMERLRDAGVEYVKFLAKDESSEVLIDITTFEPGPKDQVNFQLKNLCPYLHYSKIDSRHEMTVCGAYLNRMVLGENRRLEMCETQGHRHCEHYLNPRSCA
ncbi:hypothetical protein [Desulfotignum balticum]|uniref:hypothetical protein n=1 Tax=Desulfotignum balticum TaxID=115781 RepID=UPI00046285C1|nr:hypothetical protein [Desulfotignum balticum]